MRTRTLPNGRSVNVRENGGLKKRCRCPRRQWPKCPHPWHFGFQHNGGEWRYSLDKIADLRGDRAPRSKTDALSWADRLRAEIRSGIDPLAPAVPTVPAIDMTFGDVADGYIEGHVRTAARKAAAQRVMEYHVNGLKRAQIPAGNRTRIALRAKPIAAITKADVEHIRREWIAHRPASKNGRVGANRLLARLRHLLRWAITEGHVERTPFSLHGVPVIKLDGKAEAPRTRRLEEDEDERLLAHGEPHLRDLIIAALERGCRVGELLDLRWRDIKWDANVLLLLADVTKPHRARDVPMSRRLRAVLEMRRHAPDGTLRGLDRYAFGNEVGDQAKSVRTAWENTCERAWIENLHFHYLRREFGSRLRETPGMSDHEVRDWLGHANITTTSRYLSTTLVSLQHALRKFEEARNARTSVAQTGHDQRHDRFDPDEVRVHKSLE